MQTTVETLSPTKVKLKVEVPFADLAPHLDGAYKRIAREVKVQGFRPGKVPPRIIDQRVGRAAVLAEALDSAVSAFYSQAVEEGEVAVVSRPEVELEGFADGEPLLFSATVDVRPDLTLPEYEGIEVSVDDVDVSDESIDKQLSSLQDRFATLTAVERVVATGDYVLVDLVGRADGEVIPGSEATGLSYEVGSEGLIEGLDAAILGAAVGESRSFDTEIRFGDYAGRTATFEATITAVKEKSVPALDDEFAQTASEFDTIAELREDVRGRLERNLRLEQGVQSRDKVLQALLDRADVPLPESLVNAEVSWREQRLAEQLEGAGMTREQWLEGTGETEDGLIAEIRTAANDSVKSQLLLDAIARKEELEVNEAELTDQIVRRAQRAGLAPQDYANRLVEGGHLPSLMAEITRGKALAAVLGAAIVRDASGRDVDLSALEDDGSARGVTSAADLAAEAESLADDDHAGHDHGDHEGHDH